MSPDREQRRSLVNHDQSAIIRKLNKCFVESSICLIYGENIVVFKHGLKMVADISKHFVSISKRLNMITPHSVVTAYLLDSGTLERNTNLCDFVYILRCHYGHKVTGYCAALNKTLSFESCERLPKGGAIYAQSTGPFGLSKTLSSIDLLEDK